MLNLIWFAKRHIWTFWDIQLDKIKLVPDIWEQKAPDPYAGAGAVYNARLGSRVTQISSPKQSLIDSRRFIENIYDIRH